MKAIPYRNAQTAVLLLAAFCATLRSQEATNRFDLDSRKLAAMARHLWAPVELEAIGYAEPGLSPEQMGDRVRESCLYLEAAVALSTENELAWHDLTALLTSEFIDDAGRARQALVEYLNRKRNDSESMAAWLQAGLERLNDRQARQGYLTQHVETTLRSYPILQGEALQELGHLASQTGDLAAARNFYNQAYGTSRQNVDALAQLIALGPAEIDPTTSQLAEQELAAAQENLILRFEAFRSVLWRQHLSNNPYDLEAALRLIQELDDHGAYALAQEYYEHAVSLWDLSGEPSVERTQLRLNQLASAYSGELYRSSLAIAEEVRRSDPTNLMAAALHARALQQLARPQEAEDVLEAAIQLALASLAQSAQPPIELQEDLAWVYCLVQPDPSLALEYAENAYAANPEGLRGRAITAYAHVLNEDAESAKALLEGVDPSDPLTALVWARVYLAENDQVAAQEVLARWKGPLKGILGEAIEETLAQLTLPGEAPASAQIPPAQEIQTLIEQFLSQFSPKELEIPGSPETFLSCSMKLARGSDIVNFGDPIRLNLYLANIGDVDVALGAGNLVDPQVLITARIETRRGAAETETVVIAHRTLGQQRILRSKRSNRTTEMLNVGSLRELLELHPQQTYRVIINAYLDPVPDGQGGFRGKIAAIQPKAITVTRQAFVPTNAAMATQRQRLASGSPEAKIRTLHLFGGLLRESWTARSQPSGYALRPIDSRALLTAIRERFNDEEYRVRAWAAHALRSLPVPVASVEGQGLSKLLNDPNWFVRFMAAETLHAVADLSEYYRWAAKGDENIVIQRLAQWRLGQPWPSGVIETLSGDGLLRPTTWVGQRMPILEQITTDEALDQGNWLLLLYERNCPQCSAAITLYEAVAQALANQPAASPVDLRVGLIEMPPYGAGMVSADSVCARGQLSDARTWLATAPLVVVLTDGAVRQGWEGRAPDLITVMAALAPEIPAE